MSFWEGQSLWLYVLLITWIGGTFYLSSGRGSISRTARYVIPALRFLFPGADARDLKKYHAVFRKLCHLAGYAILGLLASAASYNSSIPTVAQFWPFAAFVTVLVVAALDEIRQSFYPDRVGSVTDVVLDCIGGLTTILVLRVFV